MSEKIPNIKIDTLQVREMINLDVFTSYQKTGKNLKFEVGSSDKGFLNLFGLFVNTGNYDIVLGQFPDRCSYIKVGNLEDIFRRVHVISERVQLDFLYLIQQLKLDLVWCFESYSNLRDEIVQNEFKSEGKSIVHNLIKFKDDTLTEEILNIDGKSLLSFIEKCMLLSVLLNCQALSVLHNFSLEETKDEEENILSKYCPDMLVGLHQHFGSGLSATYEVLSQIEGFERLYLNSLYSYGYNITSRLARLRGLIRVIQTKKIDREHISYLCKSVSSCSIDGLEDSNKILSDNNTLSYYNVCDVLSCLGIIDLVYSSLGNENDLVKILKAVHVYGLIEEKFNYEDFIGVVENYVNMLDNINSGMVYKRPINNNNKDLRCIQQVSLQNACKLMQSII